MKVERGGAFFWLLRKTVPTLLRTATCHMAPANPLSDLRLKIRGESRPPSASFGAVGTAFLGGATESGVVFLCPPSALEPTESLRGLR